MKAESARIFAASAAGADRRRDAALPAADTQPREHPAGVVVVGLQFQGLAVALDREPVLAVDHVGLAQAVVAVAHLGIELDVEAEGLDRLGGLSLAFRQLERVPVIGQTTGGSTGQPLFQKLPGGGGFQVCTKRDTAGDGSEWIGIGIRPDIEVAPTVVSLRAGEDPVLERAIAEVTGEPE